MISIIIPTLNEEKYLPSLLESIKKQEFTDYEIIIGDADSKDNTKEIAKRYGCKIAPGGLPAKGRNEGAKIAQGDLLFFIDSDSVLSDSFFTILLKEFKEKNLGVASYRVYPRGNIIDKVCYNIYNFWTWLTQKFLPHATQTILIKKEIHQEIGGFDEAIKIGEDHAYVRKAAKYGKFGFLRKVPIIFTSVRRFESKGRLKIYSIFILAGIYLLFSGKTKAKMFDSYYSKKEKST